jgi:hypothetical protein
VLWAEPEDLLETGVAVAEGGRDTRVLGDPMDLIRCQNYLAEPTVTNSTHKQDKRHCKRSVRQDGETIVMREKKGVGSFFSSQISRLLLVDKYRILTILSFLNQCNQEC